MHELKLITAIISEEHNGNCTAKQQKKKTKKKQKYLEVLFSWGSQSKAMITSLSQSMIVFNGLSLDSRNYSKMCIPNLKVLTFASDFRTFLQHTHISPTSPVGDAFQTRYPPTLN